MRNAEYQKEFENSDDHWMREALIEAHKCIRPAKTRAPQASDRELRMRHPNDVPVGALCIHEDRVLARAHNRRELDADPTAHAEVLCLREAARKLGRWDLQNATLYVTLEPCPMCAGAIWLSRVSRVVFGAWDERAGACGSVFDIARDPRLNHRVQLRGGVLEPECRTLLQEFFRLRRPPICDAA